MYINMDTDMLRKYGLQVVVSLESSLKEETQFVNPVLYRKLCDRPVSIELIHNEGGVDSIGYTVYSDGCALQRRIADESVSTHLNCVLDKLQDGSCDEIIVVSGEILFLNDFRNEFVVIKREINGVYYKHKYFVNGIKELK